MTPTSTTTTDGFLTASLPVQRRVRSGKMLDRPLQSFSAAFPDVWPPLLRNISLGLPVANVFWSNVFPRVTALQARQLRGTRAGRGRRIARHLCPSLERNNSPKRNSDPLARASYVFCSRNNLSYNKPLARGLPSMSCHQSSAARSGPRGGHIRRAGSPTRLPEGAGRAERPGHEQRSLPSTSLRAGASLGMTILESLTLSCRP